MIELLETTTSTSTVVAVVPDAMAFGYYVFLMTVGSLITWRCR
jgi:hypothetical protein